MAEVPSQPGLQRGHRTPHWVYGLVIVAIGVALLFLSMHFLGMGLTHMP
jgi:hypothetical protein